MLTTRLLLSLLLHTLGVLSSKERDDAQSSASRCVSHVFSKPKIGHGVTILSVQAQPQYNFTSIKGNAAQPPLSGLNFCQVQVYLTHHTQNEIKSGRNSTRDKVLVEIWLPLDPDDWNGRLQFTGGAGFATGMFGAHLGAAVKDGWAAVSTDGGHDADLNKLRDASWLLSDPGERLTSDSRDHQHNIRWDLLHNLASRSVLDQILIGKTITEQYFGYPAHHSYWNGCSTGGRQGYFIAQKYPNLIDGILAVAPAISFVNIVMGSLWPQVIMNAAQLYLSNCELEYFRYKAIKHCETAVETKTGILEDPANCPQWSPKQLIGEAFECDGQIVTVDQAMAEIVQHIHDGPNGRFPGLDWGVPMTSLANITTQKDGTRSPNPSRISASWLQYAVLKGKPHQISELNEQYLNQLWVSALAEYGGLLNHDDPDLTDLRGGNTKLLTWHGIDDEMIPYQNTLNYRRKVESVMGGADEVDEYYRLFLAPGVAHCGGGVGPVPKDPLNALVRWVEYQEPPETLEAEVVTSQGDLVSRDLCIWPATAQYMGIGDIKRASTWTCVGGTERLASEHILDGEFDYGTMREHFEPDQAPDRAQKILGGLKDRLEGLGMGLRVE
jgi:hypothetical protein